MELLIPVLALSGLYVINKSKNKKENFQEQPDNGWGVSSKTSLPNTDIPNVNYPNEPNTEYDLTSQLSTTNGYDGSNTYTDKYFNPQQNIDKTTTYSPLGNAGSSNISYTSLTGETVSQDYFRHNNMVPFFGGNIRSRNMNENVNEAILDNYSGSGSQTIVKTENAPLFAPEENLQWVNGTPNTTDFIRSRMNPSTRMTNVKPFEEERVGPGLGLGFGTSGSHGFNSGMMAREQWNEKTVDELRVLTNPKSGGNLIYGLEGPAIHSVTTRGDLGIQEKNRVETSFPMSPDRYLTTTGVTKGPSVYGETINKFVNRPETTTEYHGVSSSNIKSGGYIEGEQTPSHRIHLGPVPLGVAGASGKGGVYENDYGIQSQYAYPNNRSTTIKDDYFGAVGGAMGAAIAPLLDILRPSRKENTLGSLRPYQLPKPQMNASYMFDPNDKPGLTLRDTTNAGMYANINANQRGGAYEITNHQPVINERDTTSVYYTGGSSAGNHIQTARSYNAEYNQRNNDIKSSTIEGRMVPGNMSLFQADINMTGKAKDEYLKNNRPLAPGGAKNTASLYNFGQVQREPIALNSTVQLDRNNGDVLQALQGNPYVLPYKSK